MGKLALAALAAWVGVAQATVDEDSYGPSPDPALWARLFANRSTRSVPALERFLRARAVLEHFGVPEEEDPSGYLADLDGMADPDSISRALPYVDPTSQLSRFARFNEVGGVTRLEMFQDRDSRTIPDFSLALGPGEAADPVRTPPADQPLDGLTIAIDPGHMGGDEWDRITGKHVRHPDGRKLSEGVMALQVALLLERDLTALGADVRLSRRDLVPVAPTKYDEIPLEPHARNELRDATLYGWFQDLLAKAPAGPELFRIFDRSAEVRRLYSETMRWRYYLVREELDARAKFIEDSEADIALVVHFDASGPVRRDPYNASKTYVAGSFDPEELGTRSNRKHLARHLLDASAFERSIALSRAIVGSISTKLGIPRQATHGPNATRIEPGVFARNLVLTRKQRGIAMSFLECLFYDQAAEFERLSRFSRSMPIGDRDFQYSDRLVSVAEAIRDGVVSYAGALRGRMRVN